MDQTTAAGSQPTEIGLFVPQIPQASVRRIEPRQVARGDGAGHRQARAGIVEAFGPES